MGPTERIAAFVEETTYDKIPRPAIDVAKNAFLDCLGAILASSRQPDGKVLISYAKDSGGRPESVVIGGGIRCSCTDAALVNGTNAHLLELDDMHSWAHSHPSAILVPTTLALGEKLHLSAKKALTAYVVGLEVIYRLGREFGSKLHSRGFHPTAISGPMGAAAAAASLLGLNKQQTRMALGIAASEASGLRGNFGTMTKPFHTGNAARGGILAALLAQKGLTAAPDIVESEWGFLNTFTARDGFDAARVVEGLGHSFLAPELLEFKAYPSCGKTHCSIDAALHIRQEHHITADQVASVECGASDALPRVLIYSKPKSALEAKFSLQYCVAVALTDGKAGLSQFTDDRVREAKVQDLVDRVRYVHPEDMRGWDGFLSTERITVKLHDGTSYSYQVDRKEGDLGQEMTRPQLEAKYRDCTRDTLSPQALEESLKLLAKMEDISDITRLAGSVCKGA